MSTKRAVAEATFTEPKSMADAGYKLAVIGESTKAIAKFVYEQCPGFLDDVPKTVRADLYKGFQLRKHEMTPAQYYKLGEGGDYIPVTDTSLPGLVMMTIDSAMSYSQQEFGKLRQTDPRKHAIIARLRKAYSDYAGNCMRSLTAAIRQIVNADKPRERTPNKGFREAMTLVFETYEKRVKTAKERGDTDADATKYRSAVEAFWKRYDA